LPGPDLSALVELLGLPPDVGELTDVVPAEHARRLDEPDAVGDQAERDRPLPGQLRGLFAATAAPGLLNIG
jgi:hypothetical protein